jgi:hypothetical protein
MADVVNKVPDRIQPGIDQFARHAQRRYKPVFGDNADPRGRRAGALERARIIPVRRFPAVMLAAPLAGLDLPLKVLVWEDGQGAVAVSYDAPESLTERHHIEGAQRAPLDVVESIVEEVVGP